MICDLLPGPRLGHAFNSWGRSGTLLTSRLPKSLSSCDSKRQVWIFPTQSYFVEFLPLGWKASSYYRSTRNSRTLYTGSVSDFYLIFFWQMARNSEQIDILTWTLYGVCHTRRDHFAPLLYSRVFLSLSCLYSEICIIFFTDFDVDILAFIIHIQFWLVSSLTFNSNK